MWFCQFSNYHVILSLQQVTWFGQCSKYQLPNKKHNCAHVMRDIQIHCALPRSMYLYIKQFWDNIKKHISNSKYAVQSVLILTLHVFKQKNCFDLIVQFQYDCNKFMYRDSQCCLLMNNTCIRLNHLTGKL